MTSSHWLLRTPSPLPRVARQRAPGAARRGVVRALARLLVPAPLPRAAFAQKKFDGKKVVFASWGGSYQDAQKQAFCDPFAASTGASGTCTRIARSNCLSMSHSAR